MPELARVITADCSYPKEIDDAISVERVDENFEAYKVSVCVADTSGLYADPSIVEEAHRTTTAKYWDLPNGERGYDPMIDTDVIRDLELIEHKERSALVVSFIVGTQLAPSNVEIGFEQITIRRNLNYKEFSNFAHGPGQRFVRASKLIKQQLNYVAYGDHVGERPVWRGRDDPVKNMSEGAWKRGSKINESFMVATNHLVGKLFAEEGRPAIYRVHDPDDERHLEFL
jgi:exoribonuclease R